MNQKQFVPPLAHATPDPNHKSSAARSRPARHESSAPVTLHREQHRGAERLVLGIVWGAVAGLFAIAMTTNAFRKPAPQLSRYEKAKGRARDLNSQVRDWFNS